MANILLTTKCSRSCPYCFAAKEMADSTCEDGMSWENLIYLADFLKASGDRQVSLLGGEPTLHPNFVDYVLYLVERNFHVTVFSNGILSPSRLKELDKHLTPVATEKLSFVCNLNDPQQTPAPKEEVERVHSFLSVMGPWTTPGFNIYQLDFRLEFLIDFINRYGMKRWIRLGIAHPVPGIKSVYLRPEDIGRVVDRLYSSRSLLERFRIKLGLDCGFPICKFDDEQLGWLYRLGEHARFGCGPAIDIAPDMSIYYCFPLSNYNRKSIFEFDSTRQASDYFRKLQQQIRAELPGIFDECDGCIHQKEGVCAGGGVCQVLNRFTEEAPVRLPDIENELKKIRLSKQPGAA